MVDTTLDLIGQKELDDIVIEIPNHLMNDVKNIIHNKIVMIIV